MLYCGIHYNFSFDEGLILRLHQLQGRTDDIQFVRSEIYLAMAKNCYLYSWFPVLMTAASPIFHESFLDAGTPVFISEFGGGAKAGRHGPASDRFTEEYMKERFTLLTAGSMERNRAEQIYSKCFSFAEDDIRYIISEMIGSADV